MGRRRIVLMAGSLLVLFFFAFFAAACSSPTSPTTVTSVGTYSATDITVGTGTQAGSGSLVTVSYTGWLYDTSKAEGKGTQFDASSSFSFVPSAGTVILGWQQGVPGMRIGGKRRLILPPELAYGSKGAGGVIPPNATLVFDITMLNVQ